MDTHCWKTSVLEAAATALSLRCSSSDSAQHIPIEHLWTKENEPSREIMVLFVLCKLILQTCMRSQPSCGARFLVGPFVYFHTSCVRTAKAQVSLRGSAGSPESSLVADVTSTIIS